ncbi:MAG: glycine cleavage system protein H [Thermoanaerobaculia bacterium]
MTVLLIVAMFLVIILIDHLVTRQPIPVASPAPVRQTSAESRPVPAFVGGFSLPDNLRYHPGHTWALRESPKMVRVGLDDFATKIAGKIASVTLPSPGQWIRQGQKIFTVERNGHEVAVVSPIEGAVSEVNPAIAENPDLLHQDPYGEGWLITVDSPDSKTNFRNLLGGTLARRWLEDAAAKLRLFAAGPVEALAQDGGVALDDFTEHLTDEEWEKITREFFLS